MGRNNTYDCSFGATVSTCLLILVSFIGVLLLCKGLFVIIMTFRCAELQGTVNFVFASMAVNDLILSAALFFFQIASLPYDLFDSLKGKLMTCFIFGDCYGTLVVFMMHIGVLALDRYIHIFHPLYYMRCATKRRVFILLLCVWALGLVVMCIPMLVYRDDKYHERCILLHPPVVYFSVVSGIYFLIFLAVFFCYFKIAHLAFTRRKAANIRFFDTNTTAQTAIFRSNQTQALRSIEFFIAMFGIFALCSLPVVITTWFSYLHSVPNIILMVLSLLKPVYLVFNIFNYVKVNRDFSRVFHATFSRFRNLHCSRNIQS